MGSGRGTCRWVGEGGRWEEGEVTCSALIDNYNSNETSMSYFTLTMSVLMERYSLGLSERLEQSYEEKGREGERDRGREREGEREASQHYE